MSQRIVPIGVLDAFREDSDIVRTWSAQARAVTSGFVVPLGTLVVSVDGTRRRI